MNRNKTNGHSSDVDAYLKKTLNGAVPDEVDQRLRQRLHHFRDRLAADRFSLRRLRLRRWALPSGLGLAASVVIGAVLWFALLSSPQTLYAKTIEALQQVHTVHMTGWTSRIQRRFTLGEGHSDTKSPSRYKINIWLWRTKSGALKRYDQQGPIVMWQDDDLSYEHQTDTDILYIYKAKIKNDLTRLPALADKLEELRTGGLEQRPLGAAKTVDGRKIHGLQLRRDGEKKIEYWFDTVTNLPVKASRFKWVNGEWVKWSEISAQYDKAVPKATVAYTPPKTSNIHYSPDISPETEKWRTHKLILANRYENNPLTEPMDFVPRKLNNIIDVTWGRQLPGYPNYSIEPLAHKLGVYTLGHYIKSTCQAFASNGCVRVPADFRDIKLNHDLIYRSDTTPKQRIQFVLDQFGLDLIEVVKNRMVWVAHHDRRPLKPWKQVRAPVSNPDNLPLHPGMPYGWGGITMKGLFESFAWDQDSELSADKIIIIDQTGLASSSEQPDADHHNDYVSDEHPYWGEEESILIARKWFDEQFGVTFTQEVRPMTVYVVQKQQNHK